MEDGKWKMENFGFASRKSREQNSSLSLAIDNLQFTMNNFGFASRKSKEQGFSSLALAIANLQ